MRLPFAKYEGGDGDVCTLDGSLFTEVLIGGALVPEVLSEVLSSNISSSSETGDKGCVTRGGGRELSMLASVELASRVADCSIEGGLAHVVESLGGGTATLLEVRTRKKEFALCELSPLGELDIALKVKRSGLTALLLVLEELDSGTENGVDIRVVEREAPAGDRENETGTLDRGGSLSGCGLDELCHSMSARVRSCKALVRTGCGAKRLAPENSNLTAMKGGRQPFIGGRQSFIA